MQKGFYRWMVGILLGILMPGGLQAQEGKAQRLLYWGPDRRLQFSDFQRRTARGDTIFIYRNSRPDVHRLGVIATAIDVQVKREKGRTTFTIRAVMDPGASWIETAADTLTLRHEQGHFDIAEIYTRVMRRELRKARSLAHSKNIYEEVLAAEAAEQAKYDAANTFEKGGITNEWAAQIARRIKGLAAYAKPVLVLAWDR